MNSGGMFFFPQPAPEMPHLRRPAKQSPKAINQSPKLDQWVQETAIGRCKIKIKKRRDISTMASRLKPHQRMILLQKLIRFYDGGKVRAIQSDNRRIFAMSSAFCPK